MRMTDLEPEYSSGGRAVLELPGAEFHVTGIAGPSRGELDNVVFLNQVHGTSILQDPEGSEEGDGMILTRRGRYPGIRTADCLPVFFWSRTFAAALHAGWRGIEGGIAGRMLRRLPRTPDFILLGNCICRNCYTVGEDVRIRVAGASRAPGHPQGRIDLKLALLDQLEEAGLPPDTAVFNMPECTCCGAAMFHSYRRDGTEKRNLQWLAVE